MSKKKAYQWISFLVFFIMVATNTVFAKSIPLQQTSFGNTLLSQENTQVNTQENTEKKEKKTEQNQKNEQENEQNEQSDKTDTQKEAVTQENMQLNVGFELESSSCVLMEASTGAILYAKEMDKEVEPASITKIMTLILIFEAIDSGKIKLEDPVSVSEHAASMGGSQVYLEPFETQTVNDMIKCISIASANDACVAMAEHVAGSEEEFVNRMNQKAEELGMKHTKFVNCCGLDVDGHYSSALDVALMSRELIIKHPEISKYSTIWMDTITHVTKKGSSEFGLTNTNKLVRTYKGITGLKTGSTGKAKYCLSASANRNGMDMIAVVMGNPNPLQRFVEAGKLLDYGFANCSLYVDNHKDLVLPAVPVKRGLEETVEGKVNGEFHYLCLTNTNPDEIKREVTLAEEVKAPIEEGCTIGEITYRYGDKKIGSVEIVAAKQVKEAKFKDYFTKVLQKFFLSSK
ncbi:D-alanyl-D-alanine carboxypeptidase family protein [Anaerosporobacter faecicola]|uniref:D-alanyl-D-alanine carboxypeptidase family protein n=1 Tax=Anaerosporobacter faecicola TaxID=2718714 RepID=UPI001EE5A775|nr:D-alanyl-D-alanine carboxypeptidase family protein [Anaerosporobacter faecicola]